MRGKNKRNRRKRVNGYANRVPIAVVVVVAMVMLIGSLWVKSSCDALGVEIRRLEQVSQELGERLLTEDMKWNRLRSVDRIRASLATNGVRMDWPVRDQVVKLADVRPVHLVDVVPDRSTGDRYASAGRMGRYE
jgi:hypothetical protein